MHQLPNSPASRCLWQLAAAVDRITTAATYAREVGVTTVIANFDEEATLLLGAG